MSATATTRIHNFGAGPAVLPVSVLERAQQELLALPGVGMSVLEISHRSKTFEAILAGVEERLRRLAGVPASYRVLFLQGGASLQFSMVPLNLLPAEGTADYVVTGVWSQKAVKEAKRCGKVNIAASTEAGGFTRVPTADDIRLTPGAAYVHLTSNNTIYGTQFPDIPPLGDAPLVCDMSSDILSRPLEVERFGLIYAGAQKNLGPSGVTLVVMRGDLLERSPTGLHSMLSYRTHAEAGSLYNTPPTFGVYLMGLVLEWIEARGGLPALARANERKAAKLYAEIDRTGFYHGHAEPGSRSQMNVTFRLGNEELDKAFCREATAQGLDGLKGHRSTGGVRASLYNALPEASVDALVAFMREFERTHG